MKEQLNEIINDLREVCEEQNLKLSDSELMDFSTRILNTNKINKYKELPKKQFIPYKKETSNPLTKGQEPATDKQKYALEQLGKQVPAGLTKLEAIKMIKELKEEGMDY
jgi:hypothetical protein